MEMRSSNNRMPERIGSRVTVSILAFFGSLIGIVLWLFFYADKFPLYQNMVIVAVILLGYVAAMAATLAAWGMK